MMGVLPLQFVNGENADDHGLDGSETFDIQIDENVEAGKRSMSLLEKTTEKKLNAKRKYVLIQKRRII